MSLEHPIIAIIGAGAVGAYYGSRLAQHGHDVHFLLRRDYARVKENGWTIRSCDGDFTLPAKALKVYNDPHQMPKADLVIVALKTTSNDQLDPLIRPVVKQDTTVLTLQNGLGNEERLAELFGAQRVLGGMAFVCINRIEPGIVHHMSEGLVRIGELQGPATDRVRRIVALFASSNIKCLAIDDLRRARWLKLIWNIPFNGLGAALLMTTDRLLATPQGTDLVASVMTEVIAVATKIGMEFPPNTIEEQIDWTRGMGAYRTSMQIDREESRAMEVEAILGEVVRTAKRAAVAVPRIEMLYRMLCLGNTGKL
jgi:2-dehydropantoate 2-reductase